MCSSYLCLSFVTLCLVIFNLGTSEATIQIQLGMAGQIIDVTLTAAQVTTIAALAVLSKTGAIVGGILGKREADEQEINLEKLTLLEPDDCYKRIFCAASTGR